MFVWTRWDKDRVGVYVYMIVVLYVLDRVCGPDHWDAHSEFVSGSVPTRAVNSGRIFLWVSYENPKWYLCVSIWIWNMRGCINDAMLLKEEIYMWAWVVCACHLYANSCLNLRVHSFCMKNVLFPFESCLIKKTNYVLIFSFSFCLPLSLHT